MSIITYRIIGSTLSIPGIPGVWHAGQEVDVDTNANEVLATRLLPTTPEDADIEQSPDEQPIQSQVESLEYPTVAVKNAADIKMEGNEE